MKFSTLIAAVGVLGLGSARVLPMEDDTLLVDDLTTLNLTNASLDEPDVPFEGCKKVIIKDSIFEINKIQFSPNPPKVGQDVQITVKGNLKEEAPKDSIMTVKVKRGALKLTKLEYDFCEGVNTTCPVQPGDVLFSKAQFLDPRLPTNWKYNVFVEVKTKDKKQLACIKVPVRLAPKDS